MEFRQLRYFTAVAEEGSFSRAAQQLYVAQSAVSHQVATLEEELGVRLLHRVPRGVTLTEAGHVFLAHAVSVLRAVDDARLSVQGELDQPKGKVNIGLPPSVCHALAVPLIQDAQEKYPGIKLELSEAPSGDLAYQLKAGLVHVAIVFEDGVDTGELETVPMLSERFYLIAKENEKNRHFGDAMPFSAVVELPLILASQKQGVRRIVESTARKHGLPAPNVIAEVNSVSIMRSSLLAGLGYTLLPPMPVKQELDLCLLRAWPIIEPEIRRNVMIATLRGVPKTAATNAMIELVRATAARLCGTPEWEESRNDCLGA